MRGTRPDGSTLMKPGRRAGLQRVLPAVVVRAPTPSPTSASPSRSGATRRSTCSGHWRARGRRGAGAVLNIMQPRSGRRVRGVRRRRGRAAGLMAARIAGCDPIIAVDIHAQRLAPRARLGATHVIDHTGRADAARWRSVGSPADGDALLARDLGAACGFSRSRREGFDAGRQLRSARQRAGAGTEVALDMPFLQFGRVVRGVIQGESHPPEFDPAAGRFRHARGRCRSTVWCTFYPLADINRAARDLSDGTTIKPVLRMPYRTCRGIGAAEPEARSGVHS